MAIILPAREAYDTLKGHGHLYNQSRQRYLDDVLAGKKVVLYDSNGNRSEVNADQVDVYVDENGFTIDPPENIDDISERLPAIDHYHRTGVDAAIKRDTEETLESKTRKAQGLGARKETEEEKSAKKPAARKAATKAAPKKQDVIPPIPDILPPGQSFDNNNDDPASPNKGV